ncbi:MAG: aminotransferase class V-fold PLP-dependent enzyme [Thiotrichales bacterium]
MFLHEFPISSDVLHLNHAGVGPWPKRAADAAAAFAVENATLGSTHYLRWMERESRLRQQFQRLINAPSAEDIALLKNTSEALSVVAFGLRWEAGDNVVGIAEEFPSNRLPWQAASARFNIEWRPVHITDLEDPEAALMAGCDRHTRVLSVSAVQYVSGFKMDLVRLGEFCRQRDILFCVDAIQQLGALPFDVQEIQADFVAADAHKWMLGPEGIALFYVAAAQRDQLRLHQYGWHMVENVGAFDVEQWSPAQSARRFECGSPNNLAIHIQNASLDLLEEVGASTIADLIHQLVDQVIDHARARGFQILSPTARARRAGIVTFKPENCDINALYQTLLSRGVLCASRMNGIRFAPHFYTRPEVIEGAFAIVDDIVGNASRGKP